MATVLPKPNPLSRNANELLVPSESPSSTNVVLPDETAKELVRWFKLLADETRLKIIFFLLEKNELNVRSLCDLLELSQPAVSHHLALLRVDGLIECRRDGKHNYYRVLRHRFGELMSKIVSAVPGEKSQLRLGQILLTVSPPDRPEA